MLAHLEQRIADVLTANTTTTLATSGPAGLHISACPYVYHQLQMFVVVPGQSEHLVNLEIEPGVAMTADGWRVYGRVRTIETETMPLPVRHLDTRWQYVIVVTLDRFELIAPDGSTVYETIDIDRADDE